MNPASGPDYLRMEKYNPHPPPSARAEQDRAAHGAAWPSHYPSREIIAPKVLAKINRQVEAAKEIQKLHPNYRRSVAEARANVKQCCICAAEGEVGPNTHGRHHVVPRSEHPRLLSQGFNACALNKKVWLCRPCHNAVHSRWTNAELAACPWEETRFLMRNVCA